MLSVIEAFIQAPIGSHKNIILSDSPIIKYINTDHYYRKNIKIGQKVKIVEKQNQGTTNFTIGIIKKILTKKKKHTRGIKVKLTTNQVGRVQQILK